MRAGDDRAQTVMAARAPHRGWWKRYRSVVYLVIAALIFLTPVVLTHYKNVEQNRIAEEYSRNVAQLDPAERDAALAAARDYNSRLPEFGAPDPWTTGPDKNSEGYREYLGHLDAFDNMARLRAPSVGIDLPVYHGTDSSVLSHGVGHVYGTALPVGGAGTHSVLTGHTGLATLTMFDNLTHIREGEVFTVEVMGEKLAYKVTSIETVLPEEIETIRPVVDKDLLTLVTCTPYGVNSHRLLVHGERTELSGNIEQEYHSPWQPWMIAAVIIGLFVLLYLLWWIRSQRRKRHAAEDVDATSRQ